MYKQAPGYSEKATSLFVLDLGPPQDLPDALRGESWLFVQLPLSMLQQELKSVDSRAVFGDSFNLSTAGLSDLPEDTLIPGALLLDCCMCLGRGWVVPPHFPGCSWKLGRPAVVSMLKL